MWVIFALSSAFLESFSSLFRKQATIGRNDYRFIPILSILFALPVTTFLALNSWDSNADLMRVFNILLISIILNVLAVSIRYKALKIGEISEIEPLTMLTPALIIFTSYILFDESIPVNGVVGVLLISFGALYLASSRHGLKTTRSLTNIFRKKSTRYMLIVVGIWSITTLLDKMVTDEISIAVYVWLLHIGIVGGLLIFYRPTYKQLERLARKKGLVIAAIGITAALALIMQIYAVQETYVSYAIAVRRIDILITILLGALILNEKNIRKKLSGSVIMIVGLVILSL